MYKININNNLSKLMMISKNKVERKIKKFVSDCFYWICEARFCLTTAEKSGILYIEIREIVNSKIRKKNEFYK